MYSLDTSFFMDWQARYYPLDVFLSLREKIESMIGPRACAAIELVKDEIDAVGTPGLRAWAAGHAELFLPLTPEIQIEAAAIEAAYPDLMDPKGLYQSADAYVIALAKLKNGVVVSQETSGPGKAEAAKRPLRPRRLPRSRRAVHQLAWPHAAREVDLLD